MWLVDTALMYLYYTITILHTKYVDKMYCDDACVMSRFRSISIERQTLNRAWTISLSPRCFSSISCTDE